MGHEQTRIDNFGSCFSPLTWLSDPHDICSCKCIRVNSCPFAVPFCAFCAFRLQRIPFAFDRESRFQDLTAAGFQDAEVEIWRSSLTCDTARLVALYSTFSPIQALDPNSRQHFLIELARIADEQFGGKVERPLITVLYTGRRG